MNNTKQVIVIRKDLKMRRGKEIAQGSHASMAFITNKLKCDINDGCCLRNIYIKEAALDWIHSSFTKVVCRVNSLEEILELCLEAKKAGIENHIITDNGTTEFSGVPTITCCAIGPDYNDKIDKITSHLELY